VKGQTYQGFASLDVMGQTYKGLASLDVDGVNIPGVRFAPVCLNTVGPTNKFSEVHHHHHHHHDHLHHHLHPTLVFMMVMQTLQTAQGY